MNENTNTPAGVPMPRIGAPLADGIFAGIVRGNDADFALVLLAEAPKALSWNDAKAWAESLGAELPTRAEQAVLFGNLKDQFKERAYWSCEQYAGYESYAWCQYFYYGDQSYYRKDYELRARAVRRLPLQ